MRLNLPEPLTSGFSKISDEFAAAEPSLPATDLVKGTDGDRPRAAQPRL